MAIAALLIAALAALTVGPANSAEGGLPKIVDTFPRYGADVAKAVGVADLKEASEIANGDSGVALAYPKLDRLYQLYNLDDPEKYGTLVIAERDLATFKLQRVLTIPEHIAYWANGSNGAEWVSSFDHNHDILYIAYKPTGPPLNPAGGLPGMLGLDLKTFEYTDSKFPNFVAATTGSALHIAGLEYDEKSDTLLVLQAAVHTSAGNVLTLTGWNKEELTGASLPQRTPRPIRACRRDPLNDGTSQYLSPILVADGPDPDDSGKVKTWVTIPCYSTAYSSSVVLARMERSAAVDPSATAEKAIVGPPAVNNWAVDHAHGRLYLVNNSEETDAWVYEAKTNAFVGIVAMSAKGQLESGALSLGVDEASGRLYGRAYSYGLMIIAGAQDPVPQADAYPRLGAPGSYRLLVDPKRHRVLSLTGDSTGDASGADSYEVIAVPPPLPAPPREDPDLRTAQVDEQPGKTTVQYGGNASAYGLRLLFARGVSGAVPSNGVDRVGQVYKETNSYCGFTDRELSFARISKSEFSTNSRFARAAAVDVDNATAIDLADPARCDIYNNAAAQELGPAAAVVDVLRTTGVIAGLDKHGPASKTVTEQVGPHTKWDYEAADCSTKDGDDAAGPNTARMAGKTEVACTEENGISAEAEARLKIDDALPVSVKHTTTKTRVYKDPKRGLVSTATSRIEGIQIAGISIGYIENSATSFAKGRKNTAGTEFAKPEIGFVSGPGVASCTDRCDIDVVLRQLNNALTGRAEFRRVSPQEELAKGSPGGYQAGILKSEKQVASDNSLTGDKSVEIPALEMVVYNDNAKIGRARQLYQFAGVRADSYYGIQLAREGVAPGDAVVGDVIDGVTGDVVGSIGESPNGGAPLGVRLPENNENVLKRTVRQTGDYANYSLRIIFNNPREALLMATVWLLMWGPFVASRRRRALRAVIAADPEGSSRS